LDIFVSSILKYNIAIGTKRKSQRTAKYIYLIINSAALCAYSAVLCVKIGFFNTSHGYQMGFKVPMSHLKKGDLGVLKPETKKINTFVTNLELK
jgi:hypothetical protein